MKKAEPRLVYETPDVAGVSGTVNECSAFEVTIPLQPSRSHVSTANPNSILLERERH